MARRNDEATAFNESLDHLQDRAEHGDDRPSFDCDDEVRQAFLQSKQKADLEESWNEFAEHSRKIGGDAAADLERSKQFEEYARKYPAQAAAQMRTHVLTLPPEVKERALAKPEPEYSWARRPKEEGIRDIERDTSYDDTRAAVRSALAQQADKAARVRADGTLKEFSDEYGAEAPGMLKAFVGIDKRMLEDPIGNAPRLMRSFIEDTNERGMRNAKADVDSWMAVHPHVADDEHMREIMVGELNRMPQDTPNALDHAYSVAKQVMKAWDGYSNENERIDDVGGDIRSIPAVQAGLKAAAAKKRISR